MENKNVLSAQINIDTKEAQENIKELTKATDECVAALSNLEQVMGRFTHQVNTVELYCDGKLLAQSLVKHTADAIKISANVIKGVR
ncbi:MULTISPECIES: hypothetical protein [Bacillus cereus group]|uniref:hypothetical protein n=1 Tax=Bacillus cereus group TaxID=86661 RepID=UPI000627926A|nr:hypothetical protein [Bacillus pacificus]KMQ27684.1 hypothetical protein TU53_25615 [Bacillus cereus]